MHSKLNTTYWLTMLFTVLATPGCDRATTPVQQPELERYDPSGLPEIVARVDGTAITRRQLIRSVEAARNQDPEVPRDLPYYQQALQDLISSELLYQEAVARGFAISEGELDSRVAAIRERFPSAEAFEKTLTEQGLELREMRRTLGRDIAVSRYLDKTIISEISVSEEEAQRYFEENQDDIRGDDQLRVRHILIRVDEAAAESTVQSAKERLESIRNEILNGADFAALAREHSEDPGSASLGGQLDWISRGTTVPAFDRAAYSLKTGELSPIIRSSFGLHILQVTDRRPGPRVSYQDAKEQLLDFLRERKIADGIGQLAAELRGKATIETFM